MDRTRKISTLLVANRGEIAVRIIRCARELGYRSVAVYSDADASAPHVRLADDAIRLGPAPVGESYLHAEKVIEAARRAGADAIHPGYGFLSENSDFAQACADAGITFIGPSVEAIDLMGDKAAAKRRMIEAGVPCVPGYEGEDQSESAFVEAAARIGFPVMVKAAAGGGGRGMRLVDEPDDLPAALARARAEAANAFGSGELILEKAIDGARHVEIQIFADAHGNVIHLGERDCSVQRRHQKVIEEAPCPVLDETLRERMGATAVEAAESIDYLGAGTVEFLLADDGAFYFLEMNTRLQVEHPVTELVTDLDLVELQIRVAEGEPLGIDQEEVELVGHAIEARLYAEDPDADFLPSTGRIDLWLPPTGEGIRVDSGIESGVEVSPFYDPMLAKIIAWGETREQARRRLIQALRETAIFGPVSNREFLIGVLEARTFAKGRATTNFLDRESVEVVPSSWVLERAAAAAVLQYSTEGRTALDASRCVAPELAGWSSAGHLHTRYAYEAEGEDLDLSVVPTGAGGFDVRVAEESIAVEIESESGPVVRLRIGGRRRTAIYTVPEVGRITLSLDGDEGVFENRHARRGEEASAVSTGLVAAPMHGVLTEVGVAVGAAVKKGARLAVLEAMKMQHEILAPTGGYVVEISKQAGDQVAAEDCILRIDDERPKKESG